MEKVKSYKKEYLKYWCFECKFEFKFRRIQNVDCEINCPNCSYICEEVENPPNHPDHPKHFKIFEKIIIVEPPPPPEPTP